MLLPVEWVLHKNSTSVRAVSLPVAGACRTAGTCTKVSFRIKKMPQQMLQHFLSLTGQLCAWPAVRVWLTATVVCTDCGLSVRKGLSLFA